MVSGPLVRGEHQDLLRPRECHVVQAHAVEEGDAALGLERRPVVERAEIPVDPLRRGQPGGERADHDHREFESLGLVDGHHLDVARRKGPIRILVLVDAAVVQEAHEAREEVEADGLPVPVRDHGVVIVALKDVQEMGEDGEVAGRVLVPDGAPEGLQGEQAVEVVGRAQVERLALPEGGDLARPSLERLGERMRSGEAPAEADQGVVHVVCQGGHRTAELSAPAAVPAEQNRVASDQVADLGHLEECPGAGAERWDPLRVQRCQIRAAVVFAHAVQEQRHLVVVRDDPVLLQERHEIGEPLGLVAAAATPDADDRGVVGILSPVIRGDGLVVAERAAFPAGPVRRSHPAVVALHDRPVRAVVGGQLDGRAVRDAPRKLQDVAHRGAPEPVEALILVAHDAQVPILSRQLQQKLLLDVVGVLVLVHQQVARAGGQGIRMRRVVEHVVHEPLQMGEVHPVGGPQGLLVAPVRGADGRDERVAGGDERARIDKLFRDLVEVAAHAFDGGPARLPASEEQVVVGRADDLVEAFEYEQ